MLRDFVNKLVELAAPTTVEVDGSVYSNQELIHIQDKKPMPRCIDLTGLDSIQHRGDGTHVVLAQQEAQEPGKALAFPDGIPQHIIQLFHSRQEDVPQLIQNLSTTVIPICVQLCCHL